MGRCPDNMFQIDLPFSTLCFGEGVTGTYDEVEQFCEDMFRGRLCSLQQWRIAVCRAEAPDPGRSWLPDVVGGGGVFATISGCSPEEVGEAFYAGQHAGPCCLEWMNYQQ
jgi:hypothetical protein